MGVQQDKQMAPAIIDILPINMEAEIQKAKQARIALDKLFDELLVPGTDFDRVPGTDKPTLLKPGAELLCQVFHLAPGRPEMVTQSEDFQAGVFSYTMAVPIYHRETGLLVACGVGSANSKEPKYRYRKRTENGEEIRVENPDPAGEQNTLVKMASKRALVDGVLKATGASRKFTQDAEELNMPPEKASSKQISYVKILLKGKHEPEMFAEIGQVLGREVKEWDLTREEASRFIEAKKKGEQSKQGAQKDSNGGLSGKPTGNGLNWNAFWAKTRELGFERDKVHQLASEHFNAEVKTLTDVIKTQADLDGLLAWMQGTKLGGDGAASEAS